jgi:hypothetical protein
VNTNATKGGERSAPQMVKEAVAAERRRRVRRRTVVVAVVAADALLLLVAPVAGLTTAPVALVVCLVHASLGSLLRDAAAADWHLENGTVTVGKGYGARRTVTLALRSGESGRLIRGHINSPIFSQEGTLAVGWISGRPSLTVTHGNSRIYRITPET